MRATKHVVALALGAPLIAACVAAPARQPLVTGIDVPQRWSAGEAAVTEPGGRWWESFADPALVELVDRALEANHDLGAAAARVERAAAEARIAGADLAPALGLGLQAARQRQNFVGFPIPGGEGGVLSTTSTRFGLSVEASWEADLWGRLRAGARAAVADWQATDADLRAARLSLAAQTAKSWFAVVEARQQLVLARDTAASFRESAEQVRSRYEAGLRPAVELRLALSSLAGAEALVEQRRLLLDAAARRLEVLLGRYPAGALAESSAELPALPPPVPAGLPAELVARRPDLVAAERRLAAADQRYRAARRALYPRLSLTASGGTVSDQLRDLLDGDFRVWSLLGGLTQPLFQGGRLRAGVRRADAVSREALERWAASALRAFAEVESALAAEALLAERERHVAETAAQLLAARRLAAERYASGVGDYLTVLESQTRALAAEGDLLALRRQRLDTRVDLHLALGGALEPPDDAGAAAGASGEDGA